MLTQVARTVLSNAIDKHGSHLPDGVVGDEIRWAIGIMDGPIITALQDGRAPKALELWQLHHKHIGQVNENGRKGQGLKRVKYHPLLMNCTISFLAHTSARVYVEVAKIMMLLHISHVYRMMVELVSTKSDKAFGLLINTL
jgi:hypothetical protein